MPLRLITGAANAGKTGEILREALAAVAAGASPVIVVPSLGDVRRLEDELSGKTPLGIRVSSMRQFVIGMWSVWGDGRRIAGPHARKRILASLIDEGVTMELESAAKAPGFARWMARLARQSSASSVPNRAPEGSEAGIVELLGRYRRELDDRGLVEESWVKDVLGQMSPVLDGPIGVARYDTLDSRDARLLRGLAANNGVSIALTWERGFAPTRANEGVVATLAREAEQHLELEEAQPSGEIDELARRLFSGVGGLDRRGEVREGLASGLEAEAALVARFVSDAVADGFAADRIAVAFPEPGIRLDLLRWGLRSEQIPASFDVPVPLGGTEFGRAYFGLLALACGGGGRVEALAFAASPYSGTDCAQVHDRDRQWREQGVVDPSQILASLERLGGRGGLTSECVRTARAVCSGTSVSQKLQECQKLAGLFLASAVAVAENRASEIANDGAAHDAISAALVAMGQTPGLSLSAVDVVRELRGVLVRGRSDEARGGVQVCSFEGIGSRRFDMVVLAGLTESEVTSTMGTRGTSERVFAADDSEDEPDPSDLARLRFYSLVTRARHRLVLVRQDADSEGRERRASHLYQEVLDVYRQADGGGERVEHVVPCLRLARSDVEEVAPALMRNRKARRREADGLAFAHVRRSEVTSPAGLAALEHDRPFAATEIETYLECPYRWFYDRVLRPEEIDRGLDARELGTHAHDLLAAFYRRLASDRRRQRVTPEWIDEALVLFDEVTELHSCRGGKGGTLAESLAVARATTWARDVVAQDASFLPGFVPAHVEFAFGEAAPFGFAGVRFRGRIDRIDTSSEHAFLTDYKSSREVPGVAKFERQGKVQAVVYALAAQAALGLPVAGSVYRSMTSGRLRGFWRSDLLGGLPQGMCEEDGLDESGFAELVANTEERVSAAIAGMRAGRVARVPAVKGACAFCAVSAVCEGAVK